MKKQLLTGVIAASTLAIGSLGYMGAAEALTLSNSNVGDTFRIDFDGSVNEVNQTGLSSLADLTLRSFSGSQAIFDVLITNDSKSPITASRVSALGFDVNPDIKGASIVDTNYAVPFVDATNIFSSANFTKNTQFPNGFGKIDVCFIDNANNCTGGGDGGVEIGKTGAFALALAFNPSITSFTLNNFGVRYQSVLGPGLDAKGDSGTGRGTETVIPTPAAVLPGLMGMGAAVFRKKKQGEQESQVA